ELNPSGVADHVRQLELVEREVMLPCQIGQNAGSFQGAARGQRRLPERLPVKSGFQFVRQRAGKRRAAAHIRPGPQRYFRVAGRVDEYVLVDLPQREKLREAVPVVAPQTNRLAVEAKRSLYRLAIADRYEIFDKRAAEEWKVEWEDRICQAGAFESSEEVVGLHHVLERLLFQPEPAHEAVFVRSAAAGEDRSVGDCTLDRPGGISTDHV